MQTEVITAVIGAASTIAASGVGAYATLKARPDVSPAGAGVARRRSGVIVLSVGGGLAILILFAGILLGRSEAARRAEIDREAKVSGELQGYRSLVETGLSMNKPYIIPATIMLITLEKSPDGRTIDSSRRMIYTLQMLSDIKKDAPQFVEEYHSQFQLDRLPGADDEQMLDNSPTMKSWKVLFNAVSGTRHTVITGAHVTMPMKIIGNHDQHKYEGLRSNEDVFCYPNEDGDVMEEVIIMVESHTLNLSVRDGIDNARFQHGNASNPVETKQYKSQEGNHSHQIILARFYDVQKDDVVGLRVSWNP